MNSMAVAVVLAASVAMPITWVRQDDGKKSDDKKAEKRVEVKVLRLDGKDGETPHIRAFVVDSDDKAAAKHSYLGVVIEPVPAAVAAHLGDLIPSGTGLRVVDVADDSPAARAGLKEHDILLSFGDEKLQSAEQLTKLVRAEKAGNEVTLGIVHAGKASKLKVTLGEREARSAVLAFPGKARVLVDPHGQRQEAFRILKELDDKAAPGAKAGAQVKSSFSSMKLESLDGDRFKAEIEFKNEKGDSLKRSFEGTKEEIQKQIEADKELPEGIRNQLQRSFDFGKGGKGAFQFHAPRAFRFDLDNDNWPGFHWSGSGDFEQILEELSKQIDPDVREKLKEAFQNIDESQKKPVIRGRSL